MLFAPRYVVVGVNVDWLEVVPLKVLRMEDATVLLFTFQAKVSESPSVSPP
jgi:hypothetical protein